MGTPPLELTDGFTHFKPYINFANRLDNIPNLRVFWGLGLAIRADQGRDGLDLGLSVKARINLDFKK